MPRPARHSAADFPRDIVSYMDLTPGRRDRRPVVLVGDLTDADATRLIGRTHARAHGLCLVDHVPLDDSMSTEQRDTALINLAAHLWVAAQAGTFEFLYVATAWTGMRTGIKEAADALIRSFREGTGKDAIRVTTYDKVGREARPHARQVAPVALAGARQFVDQHQAPVQVRATALLIPRKARRDREAAQRAARELLDHRRASQRVIGEHLRAYAYANEANKLGVWPDYSVRELMSEVES